MNLIRDTHALLWFIDGNASLSERARGLIEDTQHTVYVSMASMWEMAITVSVGKLQTA